MVFEVVRAAIARVGGVGDGAIRIDRRRAMSRQPASLAVSHCNDGTGNDIGVIVEHRYGDAGLG